jgi:hypothetical protein
VPLLRPAAILCLSAALTAACTGEPPDRTLSRDERRPPPSAPALGPQVATLTIEGTGFALHDEGDDCLAVTVTHPGLQATVERQCFAGEQVLEATSGCGWLADPQTGSTDGWCDVDLPRALYGRVTDLGVGYVCVGTFGDAGGDSGVVSARFVPFDEEGYILDPAGWGESPPAHLFNNGGLRYGMPPLDAPSGAIYGFCEARAPWGSPEPATIVNLRIELAEVLRTDAVILVLDGGLGRYGLSGLAGDETGAIAAGLLVPQSSTGLTVRLTRADELVLDTLLPWPSGLLLAPPASEPRRDICLRLIVDGEALDGQTSAVTLALAPGVCRG